MVIQRRRGAVLERALLDAAWEELNENGYAKFTMDGVVRRAGTSPAVLYRRWSDRSDLVRAAVINVLRESRPETPDTGNVRDDLLGVMKHIATKNVALVTVMYAHLASYHQETNGSPDDLFDPVESGRQDALDALFDRAIRRGEIRAEALTARIKSLPFALLRHEILSTFAPVPDQVLEEIVDTIFLPLVQ
ncbi:TetR/AcrR family transcriptional regulator [Rhodococcus qingshengii]|uniref:TetR/AcrR family transcriptional regulator n=1 Tax=Rhodococcus qingshengii TaxID=334542 RepID=UPI0037CA84DB